MHIDLNQRAITNAFEAVDLACFDDQDVASTGFKLLTIHIPQTAPFPDELDFIIRMTMRSGTAAGLTIEEKDRNGNVTIAFTYKMMRAAFEGQLTLPKSKHILLKAINNRLAGRLPSLRSHV
jgi:hypothetical protein